MVQQPRFKSSKTGAFLNNDEADKKMTQADKKTLCIHKTTVVACSAMRLICGWNVPFTYPDYKAFRFYSHPL